MLAVAVVVEAQDQPQDFAATSGLQFPTLMLPLGRSCPPPCRVDANW
jgi:hypothetical protein